MSWLSQALHHVADAFKAQAGPPSAPAQAAIGEAADHLHAAADAAEKALPLIAEQAADAALARLGPLGIVFTPAADAFIDALVSALLARRSSAGRAGAAA